MAKKIHALNRNPYGAVTAVLTVTDIKAGAAFYQKALGFTRRGGFMNGPDGNLDSGIPRQLGHARRAAVARYDVDAWA
jgi:hypothetical protein